jgi:methylmalonyl-CoA mutase, N-terminal domain
VELLRIDPDAERRQLERTARVRSERNADDAARALAAVRDAALGEANLLPLMRDALKAMCTIGEICEALRAEWGMYDAVRSRP